MFFTRREVGKIALASLPLARAWGAINSKINGVLIGAMTYSYVGTKDLDSIIHSIVQVGIGECELMWTDAEGAMGAPDFIYEAHHPVQNAAQDEELRKWRRNVTADKFKLIRDKFAKAGIHLGVLCYNLRDYMTDEDIEWGFHLAKSLGLEKLNTATTVSMAKRVAPFAEKHKMMVGFHNNDRTDDPNSVATPERYAAVCGYGKYNAINLDIGHFTGANFDPVAYIKEQHARITNLHIKDCKKNRVRPIVPWGQGDTPIKEVLQLMRREKYTFPANIELEYPIPPGSNATAEVGKCFEFCKQALA